ncbi:MAG: hypothetical protein WB493_10610, partial [Anaeromyxobacteraceae bacterium]
MGLADGGNRIHIGRESGERSAIATNRTKTPGRFTAAAALLALVACSGTRSDGSAAQPPPQAAPGAPAPSPQDTGSLLLSVHLVGDARGTVTASGATLTCSALVGEAATATRMCWALVPSASPPRTVRLEASPEGPDARFSGWGGNCSGVAACELSMSGAASVTAGFT